MSHPNRREFLRTVAVGSMAVGGAVTLAGCELGGFEFLHGVASGDPLAHRVILWTRVTGDAAMEEIWRRLKAEASGSLQARQRWLESRRVPVVWEVALDAGFRELVARGVALARAENDFTIKVDVGALRPATTYYYRFRCLGAVSPLGRTRTLPRGSVERVRLAVVSCSNYPAGFFNVYARIAERDDLDVVLHLGDYLYEYDANGYASEQASALGRVVEPATEIVALADYRTRHAQYKLDPDAQALHAALPMIAVWDDHEIANDAWRDGAQNHDAGVEGSWAARRAAAIQAYHEWMPTRLPEPARPERIFRSFDFGDLVSLHMLDTRLIGRERQLALADFIGAAGLDAAGFAAAVGDPARQLLGAEQTAWLQTQLARSGAVWQILGQQVLMGRMDVPLPLLTGTTVSTYAAVVSKAQAGLPLLPQEQALLGQPSLPYNLDAWDGYAAARETVLGFARTLDRNLVVLSGDTHNAWANDLVDASGAAVGVEFATPSVSSPGFEALFPDEPPLAFADALQQLIGPLVYADTSRRGYLEVEATRGQVQARWFFVDTIASRGGSTSVGRALRTLPGAGQRRILEA
jgi:alkaline phosphatase D